MARKEYGTTWWGRKWLDSLSGIDYDNRIPRGLAYARTGKVFDLKIDLKNHQIEAFVYGRSEYCYKIKLTFKQADRNKVKLFMDEVVKDLEIVSLLTNRELSPKLFTIAQNCNLQIFPTSWRDLEMSCDCPDWAVPCKHIAAVIYETSQLIDANPDLIFKLIGIDLQSELEARQVFTFEDQEQESVPRFIDRYLKALIGPEQLKKIASEQNFELTLEPVDAHEAKILYQSPDLVTYNNDEVLFDDSLRAEFDSLHYLQKRVNDYSVALEQLKEEIKECDKDIAAADFKLKNMQSSADAVRAKRSAKSARDRALLAVYDQTVNTINDRKSNKEALLRRLHRLQEQYQVTSDDLEKNRDKNEQALKEQLQLQQEQLRLGYDAKAEQERLHQEAQAQAAAKAEAQNVAKQQAADAAFISELDAIDNGDDGSSEVQADTDAAVNVAETTDASADVNADEQLDLSQVRRYTGSVDQLERLTYEASIPDLSDAILNLFAENTAGYTNGKLRDQFDVCLAQAAKLAAKQLSNTNDRDLVVFDYGDQYKQSQEYAHDAEATAEAAEAAEAVATDAANAASASSTAATAASAESTEVAAETKTKDNKPKSASTKSVSLQEQIDPNDVKLRFDDLEVYRTQLDKELTLIAQFIKVSAVLNSYVPKRGSKPKRITDALEQEQNLLVALQTIQAKRTELLGVSLPVGKFDLETKLQALGCVWHTLELESEKCINQMNLTSGEVNDKLFNKSVELTGLISRLKQQVATLLEIDVAALTVDLLKEHLMQALVAANEQQSDARLEKVLNLLLSLQSESELNALLVIPQVVESEVEAEPQDVADAVDAVDAADATDAADSSASSTTATAAEAGAAGAGAGTSVSSSKGEDAGNAAAPSMTHPDGTLDTSSPIFRPWPVDPSLVVVNEKANQVFKKAAEVLLTGKNLPPKPIVGHLAYGEKMDNLKQFSCMPIEESGYFSHSPLFYWDEHSLLLQVNTPMEVTTFLKGKEVKYSLFVSPYSAVPAVDFAKDWREKHAAALTQKALVDAMYTSVAKGKAVRVAANGGRWSSLVVKAEDVPSRMFEPTGLYEMFSGFDYAKQPIREQSLEIRILYCLWFIASNLVKARAIMPQLMLNEAGDMQCCWLPATISPEVRDLVTKVGLSLQGYEHFLFNRLDRQYYLHPQFLGEMLLAPFIQSYLAWSVDDMTLIQTRDTTDLSVIFAEEELHLSQITSHDFELTGIKYRLENWLAPVNTRSNLRYIPVMRFIDLGDYEQYCDSIFADMDEEIREEAEQTYEQQQEAIQNLSSSASSQMMDFISNVLSGSEQQDSAQHVSASPVDKVAQYGVGMELGFMGFPPEMQEDLEDAGFVDETGFVPLRYILKEDLFKPVRQECMRTISRFNTLVPSLSKLFSSKNNVLVLPLPEVYKTLSVAYSALQLLGVRLVIPKSLEHMLRPSAVMKMDLPDNKPIQTFMDLSSLLNFSWQVAVGDHALSGDEFKLLMANAGQVVRFKDRFVYADPEMLRRIQERYEMLQRMNTSKSELLEAALTGSFDEYDVVLSQRLREVLDKMLGTEQIDLPQGLKKSPNNVLREYQVRGYEWLIRNARIQVGSILADDMGLGKTLQVITALLRLKEDNILSAEHPALVVVPTSLLRNWVHEIESRADNLSVYTYYGTGAELNGVKTDIILTSYGTARNRINELKKWHFSVLVIDEAQAIKTMTTALNKALRTLTADNFIAMSGTPVENRLLEYYSILDFVNRGLFGTVRGFTKNFAVPIERNRDPKKVERFKRLTAPFILRRLKTDKNVINDLPDKIISDQYCSLTPTQASLYQSVVNRKMELLNQGEMDPAARRALVLSMIQNLKAVCNSPAQYSQNNGSYNPADSGKVERLLELLEDVMATKDSKVLIFTQSVIMGKLLQPIIAEKFGHTPQFLYGGLSPQDRANMVDRFQHDAKERVMLLSLRAAGTGLNLTAANTVIHFDLWWNPAVENQATDRAFRIGQKRKVTVYRFICAHTFEERINAMINSKRDLADMAVVTGENWIGNLSNRQLNDLFSLHED